MIDDLHLGLTPWRLNGALDADSLCTQAKLAEDWGFDSFFLPETHFTSTAPIPDPMLLLAAVAARTKRIRLGTSSYLLPIRHPLLAAEQVASLDQLSAGRVILGLGRGFQTGMLEAFGVARNEKRERFAASLEAMLAAWRGEPVGDPAHQLALSPRPWQQPHPPLWIAAFGNKALEQAGSLGLPYLASPMETVGELEQNLACYHRALQASTCQRPETVAAMRVVFVSNDATRCEAVRDKLASTPRSFFRAAEEASVEDWCLLGSAAQVSESIAALRERLGITYLIAVRPRVRGIAESWNRESMEALASL